MSIFTEMALKAISEADKIVVSPISYSHVGNFRTYRVNDRISVEAGEDGEYAALLIGGIYAANIPSVEVMPGIMKKIQ